MVAEAYPRTKSDDAFLSVNGCQAGMNCPSNCGGRLYQPEKLGVIIRVKGQQCYCLSHAHRKFEELVSFYPEPCQKAMKVISKVYAFDKQTKEMTSQARLIHHKSRRCSV